MNKPEHATRQKQRDYGVYYELATALTDGPRTLEEIEDYLGAYYRMFGMYVWQLRLSPRAKSHRQNSLMEELAEIQRRGWAQFDGQRYSLTKAGREEATKVLRDMRNVRLLLDRLQNPETVSKVSLAVYLILSAIKLPAGLLSGSVGLINDSLDTLLDGLCSLLVYLGFHFQKERLVNIFQAVMLLLAGCLTLYQAISGLFRPYEPDVDLFTFFAAILSALACTGLYFYQRSVGLKSGSFGLITQSIDSRNHVIVAAGVTLGLIASLLKFGLLDTLVGLVVAVLILKSAVEIGIELFRSLQSEQAVDLSHYRMTFTMFEQYQRDQLCDWMLYLVQQGKARDRSQLKALADQAITFSHHPVLRELRLGESDMEDKTVNLALQQIAERGWMVFEPLLELTPAGQDHLKKQTAHVRRVRRHRRMQPGPLSQ